MSLPILVLLLSHACLQDAGNLSMLQRSLRKIAQVLSSNYECTGCYPSRLYCHCQRQLLCLLSRLSPQGCQVQTSARGSVRRASFSPPLRTQSPLSSWFVIRCAFVEAHTTQSMECFLSHSAAFFLGLDKLLNM